MQILYDKNTGEMYVDWLKRMFFDEGFSVPLTEIMEQFHVSKSWVFSHIQANISFVRYTKNGLLQLGLDKSKGFIYVCQNELHDWLNKNSQGSVQTKLIAFPKDMFSDEEQDEISKCSAPNTIPEEILDAHDIEFCNANERDRNRYARVSIDVNGWFEKEFYPANNRGELLYRHAFSCADTKVKLCDKTFFVRAEDACQYDTGEVVPTDDRDFFYMVVAIGE